MPPSGARRVEGVARHVAGAPFGGGSLDDAFLHLQGMRRSLPPGTFVFVCSDFLAPPEPAWWARALAYRWDVVPVIVQDPRWEQSFPAASGVALPVTDGSAGFELVRLRRREAAQRRADNQRRLTTLQRDLAERDVDPVLLSSADPGAIHSAPAGVKWV